MPFAPPDLFGPEEPTLPPDTVRHVHPWQAMADELDAAKARELDLLGKVARLESELALCRAHCTIMSAFIVEADREAKMVLRVKT